MYLKNLNTVNPYSDLLNTAQRDLEASRVLHHTENYPAAVFYYQQAVEKACKFWGLSTGLITWEGIRRIGHNPDKVFRILFIKHISITEKDAESEYDKMFNDFCKDFSLEERVKKVLGEIYNITDRPVIPILPKQSPYDAVAAYFAKDPKAAMLHPSIVADLEKFKHHPLRDKVAADFLIDTENECKMPACLMVLSLLVFATEQNARYPDIAKGIKPEDLYNEDTLFVQQIPFLCDLLNHNLKILHTYPNERYKKPRFAKSQ